ncbi:ABC-type amino acid transport system permease subunit [Paenibacillus sp. RC254]
MKDTSILSVIGLVELTQSGKIVIITLTKIADYLEVKVRRG